jgi:hypothetical protein
MASSFISEGADWNSLADDDRCARFRLDLLGATATSWQEGGLPDEA